MERLYGNSTHFVRASCAGFALAGLPESEHDDLFATFAGGESGQTAIRDAAFRFALDRAKVTGRITDYFDLGGGNAFLVDEYVDLEVNNSISVDKIEKQMDLNKKDWLYISKVPSSGKRKVRAAIGRMNHNWTEEGVVEMLAKPNSRLKGSGAWVREAYLAARPDYDNKGSLSFPDKESSRWRHVCSDLVYFPFLWRGILRRWRCDLYWVGREHNASLRLCLLCE